MQIDGVEAASGTYLVRSQHALHYHELEVAGGTRTVTVSSEHGERATIEVEAGGSEPWPFVSYWGAEGDAPFNLRTTSERPAME